MFIAYTDIGLFASDNGGQSWMSATRGVPARWVNTTYWIASTPRWRAGVGAMSYTHDLPRPKMWRRSSENSRAESASATTAAGLGRLRTRACPHGHHAHSARPNQSSPGSRPLRHGIWEGSLQVGGQRQDVGAEERGLAEPEPFAWRLASRSERRSLSRRRSPQRGRQFRKRGRRRPLSLARRREHWKRISLPEGVNGPNGVAADRRIRTAVSRGLGPPDPEGRGRWRHLCFYGWREILAECLGSRPARYDVTVDRATRAPSMRAASSPLPGARPTVARPGNASRFSTSSGHRVIPTRKTRK